MLTRFVCVDCSRMQLCTRLCVRGLMHLRLKMVSYVLRD